MRGSFDQERHQLLKQFNAIQQGEHRFVDEYLLQLFRFQYKYNQVYLDFCNNIGVNDKIVDNKSKIPYLPISAFKFQKVITGKFIPEVIFKSSGTTGLIQSVHYVRDQQFYLQNSSKIWSQYFHSVNKYCFLALLPGYLEREGSSLISMTDYFIKSSAYPISGFYLRDYQSLLTNLTECKNQKIPTVLLGVTFALMDFIEQFQVYFPDLLIIETGGMKGNRTEMTKPELHYELQNAFGVSKVYSEYGMTELMSQTYTNGSTLFKSNVFMQVETHQINDPLSKEKKGKAGIISIADLANIDSCAFIQTEDLGISHADGNFEILGRLDYADLRGCNLLMQESGLM